jgi:hypothetical protein
LSFVETEMLQIVEPFFRAIKLANTEEQLRDVLGATANRFGFRSGMLAECGEISGSVCFLLDTRPDRKTWWEANYEHTVELLPKSIQPRLMTEPLVVLESDRVVGPISTARESMRQLDLLELTLIPITRRGLLAGYLAFSGPTTLGSREYLALQTISVSLFVQCRLMRPALVATPRFH